MHEVRYPHTLVVMPSERLEDRVVFDDALSDGWRVQNKAWSESHPYDLNEDAVVFGGERSASFRVFDGDWDWVVRFRPGERFDTAGYESLRFAVNVDRMFHPRQQGPTFSVYMGETLLVRRVGGYSQSWLAEVEVTLGAFQQVEMLEEISFQEVPDGFTWTRYGLLGEYYGRKNIGGLPRS